MWNANTLSYPQNTQQGYCPPPLLAVSIHLPQDHHHHHHHQGCPQHQQVLPPQRQRSLLSNHHHQQHQQRPPTLTVVGHLHRVACPHNNNTQSRLPPLPQVQHTPVHQEYYTLCSHQHHTLHIILLTLRPLSTCRHTPAVIPPCHMARRNKGGRDRAWTRERSHTRE